MTPATRRKREELLLFVERVLAHEPAVQGAAGIGSIASGRMRPDSDIDVIVFLDPMSWYVIPGEFIWRPSDGTFHSIFTDDAAVLSEGLELDAQRLDWRQWADPTFEWPEGRKAEMAQGWIAFDRRGQLQKLISERTEYPAALRQRRLDESVTWLDQHLGEDGPAVRWNSLGPLIAFDRLQAAYHYLLSGLFAYNWAWRPWRNRQMDSLLMLPWLPERFEARIAAAANSDGLSYEAYLARAEALTGLFHDLTERLLDDDIYDAAPVEEAFIRSHDEPGYAWNMDEWNAARSRSLAGDAEAIMKARAPQ